MKDIRESVAVENARMAQSSFVNVNLAQSRFDDVCLRGSTFTNIDLSGVAFTNINFAGASIADANLAGMTVNGISIDAMMIAYRNSQTRHEGRAGAVLYAKDVKRLQEFYERAIGLTVEHAAPEHVILASPAIQLVLVEVPASIAASINLETPPRVRAETPIKLAFFTDSIASVRESAPRYGGAVLSADREWDFRDTRVCDGNDSEGNVFQLRERRA